MDRQQKPKSASSSSAPATAAAPPPPPPPRSGCPDEQEGLLSEYEPLRRRDVRSEIRHLRSAFASAEESWRAEVEAYEGTSSSSTADDGVVDGGGGAAGPGRTGAKEEEEKEAATAVAAAAPPQSRPGGTVASPGVRNCPNAAGTVSDPSLFPYHDALYPLLDAYDALPPPAGLPSSSSPETNVVVVVPPSPVPVEGRRRSNDPGEASVGGCMPNSARAVRTALLPRGRCRGAGGDVWKSHARYHRFVGDDDDGDGDEDYDEYLDNWNDYSFLRSWGEEIVDDAKGGRGKGGSGGGVGLAPPSADDGDDEDGGDSEGLAGDGDGDDDDVADLGDDGPIRRFGPEKLPRSRAERADVLLKVVRHATSELQRDHRLGRAALLLLADWKVCDDDDDDDDDEDDEGAGGDGGAAGRLRKLLAVVSAEYVHGCLGVCHDDWFQDNQGGGGFAEDDGAEEDELEEEEEEEEQQQQQQQQGEGGEGEAGERSEADGADAEGDDDDDDGGGPPRETSSEGPYLIADDYGVYEEEWEDDGEDEDEDNEGEEFEEPVDLPNHYCNDWTFFRQTLSLLVSDGITHVTSSHATTFSAYVLMEYDGVSSAAAVLDEEFFEGGAADEAGIENHRPNGTAAAAASPPPPSSILADGEASSAAAAAASSSRAQESKQKSYLKHNLFYLNSAAAYSEANGAAGVGNEGEADVSRAARDPFRVDVVAAIAAGLGVHAANDRLKVARLKKRIDDCDDDDDADPEVRSELVGALRRAVDSHANCVRTLVDIGENTVRRLPPNSLAAMVGGCVVRSLLQAYLDRPSDAAAEDGDGKTAPSSEPRRYAYFADDDPPPGLRLRTMLDPRRYADAVADASGRLGRPSVECRSGDGATLVAERTLRSPPPADVVDVVRSLFLRDLVDVLAAGCGYGDFLVWLNLPVTPLDPMIFDHVSNYPDKTQDQTGGGWGRDEEDDYLTGDALAARYDFTLLMLLREWHKPWTPGSHLSFQTPFRRAVSTLALCAHRYGVPTDLVILVNRFLPRTWWADERQECWCHDCQLGRLSDSIRRKVLAREGGGGGGNAENQPARQQPRLPGACPPFGAPPPPKSTKPNSIHTCPGCGIALYCSKEHQKYLWQDGHKRVCGKAPFRVPGVEEERLVGEVFGSEIDIVVPPGVYEAVESDDTDGDGSQGVGDAGDDSSCWESVDSDDDNEGFASSTVLPLSRSRIIAKFFEKAYRSQEIATGAFANFYTGYHH